MSGCKDRLEAYLREHRVPYEIKQHRLAYTAQEIAAIEHVPGKMMAKVVMVMADGKPVMATVPAISRVSIDRIARDLGAREVRIAREDEFAALFPDCEVGAMPPFGNLYSVPVWVDRELAEDETIVFNAGSHTETMSLAYADYARLVQPHLSEIGRHA
jgi:Ala-tRNA(Pro) deacylase